MTDEEIARAMEKAIEEDPRSPEERLRGLSNAGIIDAQGRVFSENLRMVEDLLHEKGFDGFSGISAFHIGGVPSGAVRLHEKRKVGREAEGPYDKIRALIKKARSHEGLWKSLTTAGYVTKSGEADKKKTG
jgi:hypothetical protein